MNTIKIGVLHALVAAIGALVTGGLSAADSLSDKLSESVRTVPGQILTYSAGNATEEGYEPWRHLQRFQVHLRELDTENKLEVVGCEAGDTLRTCEDLESAIRGDQPKGTKEIVNLIYKVYDSDWNTGVEKLFTTALARTNCVQEKTCLEEPGEPMVLVTLTTVKENFPEPACQNYSQPCYTRSICTAFGGCSKSKFSCQQCNP